MQSSNIAQSSINQESKEFLFFLFKVLTEEMSFQLSFKLSQG